MGVNTPIPGLEQHALPAALNDTNFFAACSFSREMSDLGLEGTVSAFNGVVTFQMPFDDARKLLSRAHT